jgi:hypothetical protein
VSVYERSGLPKTQEETAADFTAKLQCGVVRFRRRRGAVRATQIRISNEVRRFSGTHDFAQQ